MGHSIKELINDPKKECCICGKRIKGYGNNPWPVAKNGQCCDECNYDVVLPARIKGTAKTSVEDKLPEKHVPTEDIKSMFNMLWDDIEFSIEKADYSARAMLEDGEISVEQYQQTMKDFDKKIIQILYDAGTNVRKLDR